VTQIRLNQLKLHKNQPNEDMAGSDLWWNTWNVQFTVICDVWLNSRLKWYSVVIVF
jgi:hypothetical protein